MHFTTILASLSLSTLAAAWTLDLYGTDGRHENFHGTTNSGCINIAFTPALNVNQAKFDPSTAFFPDPTTFSLYASKGCQGLSYRNNKGDFKLTPARKILSYSVTGGVSLKGRMEIPAEVEKRDVEVFDAEA